MSRYNRRFPHQPIVAKLDTYSVAAVAPFQSTVILAANPRAKGPRGAWKWRTSLGRYSIETGPPPAIPTPDWFSGLVVLAHNAPPAARKKRLVLYPPGTVGPAPQPYPYGTFLGLFVKAVAGRRPDVRKRTHVTRLRLTPAGGFVGAKLGFLTTTLTRPVKQFTAAPTRQANLTVQ